VLTPLLVGADQKTTSSPDRRHLYVRVVVGISALGSVAEVTERWMTALRERGLLGTNQQGRT
jgi:hypothetical protein